MADKNGKRQNETSLSKVGQIYSEVPSMKESIVYTNTIYLIKI